MRLCRDGYPLAPGAPDLLDTPTLPPQHLITLSSIEDDALGEELQGAWEGEPNAAVTDHAGLPVPRGVDAPKRRFPVAMLFLTPKNLAQ